MLFSNVTGQKDPVLIASDILRDNVGNIRILPLLTCDVYNTEESNAA